MSAQQPPERTADRCPWSTCTQHKPHPCVLHAIALPRMACCCSGWLHRCGASWCPTWFAGQALWRERIQAHASMACELAMRACKGITQHGLAAVICWLVRVCGHGGRRGSKTCFFSSILSHACIRLLMHSRNTHQHTPSSSCTAGGALPAFGQSYACPRHVRSQGRALPATTSAASCRQPYPCLLAAAAAVQLAGLLEGLCPGTWRRRHPCCAPVGLPTSSCL